MTARNRLFELHEALTAAAFKTMELKNQDYAGEDDPYRNFYSAEKRGIHPVIGILLRVDDKLSRVQSFIENGKLVVENEGLHDALQDVINYMVLIGGLVEEQNRMDKSGRESVQQMREIPNTKEKIVPNKASIYLMGEDD